MSEYNCVAFLRQLPYFFHQLRAVLLHHRGKRSRQIDHLRTHFLFLCLSFLSLFSLLSFFSLLTTDHRPLTTDHFPSTLAPRSGLISSVPRGNIRQNSLRTRLVIVALLFSP